MPTTSNYGLRYPSTNDFVAAGATNIRELAQDVVGAFNGFGGAKGQCTAGTTSGTTGLTLADYTFTTPVADMIVLCLGMIRYTQSNSADEFRLYITETTGSDTVLSELALPSAGSTAESSGTVFAVAQLSNGETRRFRLFVRRQSGSGSLTVTSTADANRYAFIALPGNF